MRSAPDTAFAMEWTPEEFRMVSLTKNENRWNISGTWTEPWTPQSRGSALKEFVGKNKLQGTAVLLAASRRDIFLNMLPDTVGETPIAETAAKIFPLPLDELLCAHNRLPREENPRILMTAISKSRVADFREVLESAGLSLRGVGVGFAAQIAAINYFEPNLLTNGTALVLNIQETSAELTFIENSKPLFCRHLSLAGVDALVADIRNTVDYIEKNHALRGVDRIYVIAPKPDAIDWNAQLTAEFPGTPIKNNANNVSLPAAGLVFSLGDPAALWLERPATAGFPGMETLKRHKSALLVAASVILILSSVLVNGAYQRRQDRLTQRELERQAAEANRHKRDASDNVALQSLFDIARQTPRGLHLLEFSFNAYENAVSIKGRAATYAKVSEFVAELSKQPHFERVSDQKANLIPVNQQPVVEFSLEARLHGRPRRAPLGTETEPPVRVADAQLGTLSQLAKDTGVRRLLSAGLVNAGAAQNIQLDWLGGQHASMRFLHALYMGHFTGDCLSVRLAASTDEPGLVVAQAVFETDADPAIDDKNRFALRMPDMPPRDIFIPLWNERRDTPASLVANAVKRQEETQRKDQERQEQEQKRRAEDERVENKKHELETRFLVTGIVNNGHEPLAFVSTRDGSNQSTMIRNGDTLADARVTAIDEKRGEVALDYLGKFQVLLRINQ